MQLHQKATFNKLIMEQYEINTQYEKIYLVLYANQCFKTNLTFLIKAWGQVVLYITFAILKLSEFSIRYISFFKLFTD